MCKCTDLTHEEVRSLIKTKELKSRYAIMQELGWKTSGGCPSCQPALNYYLLADWPLEYKDDYQARFINERVHANIQKDGTFSVIPRMWGGVTNAAELRAIADVVDRFKIPTVKVTGGQRIDLLGVKKQDLPAVWAQLIASGLMSGFGYGKSLRTVKTCVGTDWCRFGTQDSTGLGIQLEKLMAGSWTPAKLKLAVSGCPRNCAESTIKDIGVICVDSGYDLHIAGAAACTSRRPTCSAMSIPKRRRSNIFAPSPRCTVKKPPISTGFTSGWPRPGWSGCAMPSWKITTTARLCSNVSCCRSAFLAGPLG